MATRTGLIVLLLAGMGMAGAAEWEVVLLKPTGCSNCALLEENLKRSAQLRQAVLDDGKGGQVTAPIQRRSPAELSDREWSELRALPGFDGVRWRQRAGEGSAMVLLKRDGVIASAGDIADSADLRGTRLAENLTTPQVGRDLAAVRNERATSTSNLYVDSWNLSWFYQLALDPDLRRSREGRSWIAANTGVLVPPLGTANVLLASTASGADDNEIFNALRIEEIRDVLAGPLSLQPAQLRIFYGDGNSQGANALEVRGGQIGLVRRNVAGANPFTADAVRRIFNSIRERPGSRNLLVLVGHGSPEGMGMWGSPTALSPTALRALHEHGGGDDVLVSGNCFGGVMAQAASCGFFGARPDLVATGCQADAAVVAQSRDYLHAFFSSFQPAALPTADADGDGSISFAEAHWYASTEGDPRNVTYTSIDALVDDWFAANPGTLPASLSVRDAQALARQAPRAEGKALQRLLAEHHPDLVLSLQDIAGQAGRWQPGSVLPRAMTGQLVRRLLFLERAAGQRGDVAKLQSCENRSVAAFLKR
jgi:hypothetical protein